MGRVRRAGIIHAPVEQVWAALNAIEHTPEWVVGLARAEVITSAPFGRGSAYIDYNRLGPIPQRTTWTVTEFEPYACQVHTSESSIIPTTMTIGLWPVVGGTRLEFDVEYAFLPAFGRLGRALERAAMTSMIAGVLEQNIANLDRWLSPQPAPRVTGVHAPARA
jgi:uncharacterized protein YndB with AHSA1/START domain